jgi:hypothetical protein
VQSVELVRHPSTPTDVVRAVSALARRDGTQRLAVRFEVDADLAHVRVPGSRPPRFVMQLWEHTCFEVFVGIDGSPVYHEYNLAPSGEWAAFEFARYREVESLGHERPPPRIGLRSTGDHLQLTASIALDRLTATDPAAPLRLGLSAVIEQADGTLSYWALRHPPGRPDFHHASAFALLLQCGREP